MLYDMSVRKRHASTRPRRLTSIAIPRNREIRSIDQSISLEFPHIHEILHHRVRKQFVVPIRIRLERVTFAMNTKTTRMSESGAPHFPEPHVRVHARSHTFQPRHDRHSQAHEKLYRAHEKLYESFSNQSRLIEGGYLVLHASYCQSYTSPSIPNQYANAM